MLKQNTSWKFLAAFFGLIAFGVAAMVTVNIVVDPFWRFDLVNIPGFNAQRSQFANHMRLGKAGVACRLQPVTAVLGTSRVEVGIDPRHLALRGVSEPIYNMALAGSGLKELDLTLRHTVHASPRLKQVLIGLDFLMFNAHREAVVFGTEVLDFDEKRLLLSKRDSCLRPLLFDADELLGTKALIFSAATIANEISEPKYGSPNLTKWLAVYNRDGHRPNFYILDKIEAPQIGYRNMYSNFSQEGYYTRKVWRPAPEQRYCFVRDGQPSTFDTFRELLQFARASGVELRLFINPVHARLLIALREAGLWPLYEDWKRGMIDVLAAEAAEAGKPSFPLWDFSGFNSITNEHIPPAEDKTTILRGFWEPSHYKSGIGDMMLDVMTDYRDPARPLPDDFGVRLTPATIENWISKSRADMRQYMRAEPDDAALVRSVVEKVLQGGEGANCGNDIQLLREAGAANARQEPAAAQTLTQRAIAVHQAERQHYAELDVPYRETGFEKMLTQIKAGLTIQPRLPTWQAYQERGIQRSTAGDHLGAADDFATAIRIGPVNTALHFLRGVALLNAKQMPEAAKEFESGLKLEPANPTLAQLLKQAQGTTATP